MQDLADIEGVVDIHRTCGVYTRMMICVEQYYWSLRWFELKPVNEEADELAWNF